MELAEGYFIDKIQNMSQEVAFKYFKQIAEGLNHLHTEQGIVHRDLKLNNILIKGDEIKICGFDWAEKKTNYSEEYLGEEGYNAIAPYLAPEVLKGKEYGLRADIWALGIVFYNMLTNGGHPFNPKNLKSIDRLVKRIKNDEIEFSDKIQNQVHLDILRGWITCIII